MTDEEIAKGLTPEQIEDGWKPHDGGPRPLGTRYPMVVMFRNGDMEVATHPREFEWRWAETRFGNHLIDYSGGHFADITAYKELSNG